VLPPLAFIGQQVAFVGAASTPIWLAGLWRLSLRPSLPHLHLFPIAYGVMIALVYVVHGKAYYLAPIYPVLLANGALVIEDWLTRPAYRQVALSVVAGAGALTAPLVLPILPPGDWASYAHALGASSRTSATQTHDQGVLPQHLADMLGWREMAKKVSAVYNALPPGQRAKAIFFGRNYGEAAAIDVYGPALHGPPAISGHNNYYLWGPRGYDGSVVIVVGGDPVQYAKVYQRIERVGELNSPYAVPSETNIPIYVLRGPRIPFTRLWPRLKHYD
jgi:hypothetical protein